MELKGRGTLGGENRREKSLRNGVHHADGVVWGPVYRTRLSHLLELEERRVALAPGLSHRVVELREPALALGFRVPFPVVLVPSSVRVVLEGVAHDARVAASQKTR
eukprot:30491-Pelagococcus_subviridis.AAC.2